MSSTYRSGQPFSVDAYAAEQRRRLEAIRQNTAKEQAVLKQQQLELEGGPHHPTVSHTLHSVLAGDNNNSPTRQTASIVHFGLPSGGGGAEDPVNGQLRQRSRQLLEDEKDLAREEREADSLESTTSIRMQELDHRKRELLQRLTRAQHNEKAVQEREGRAARREEANKEKFLSLHEKEREQRHNQALLAGEVGERKNQLDAAQRKAEEHQHEEARNLSRLHAQIREMEERLRTVEMQLAVKSRALDDTEREISREESKARDFELHRIEALRRDIDSRVAGSHTMSMM